MRKLSMYGPSLVVLLTAMVVLVAGPRAVYELTHKQMTTRAILASERLAKGSILEELNLAYQDIAAAVEPSVVHVSAERPLSGMIGSRRTAVSSGSGWIYDEDGHIITNHHVIDGATKIDVQLYNGEVRPATIVGFDRTTDIAVLKIPGGRLYPATRSNDRRLVQRGEMVFAFGSPFDFRFSMSAGVVSGTGRSVGVIRDQWGNRSGSEYFIQVDAAINPGNSGGPLTDFRGRVIGMNTAIATNSRGDRLEDGVFSGIGLAIPIDMIEPTVTQIITTGVVRKGYLGVHVLNREESLRVEYQNLGFESHGVIVGRIPASARDQFDEALHQGDVITHIEGRQIGSPEQFFAVLDSIDVGRPIDVRLWRYDAEINRGMRMTATLDETMRTQLYDLTILSLLDSIGRRLETLGFRGNGVLVSLAEQGEPARSAGVTRGDVITNVNDKPVAQREQLQAIIAALQPDAIAELLIWRFDEELQLGQSITIEVPLAELDLLRVRGILDPGLIVDSIPALGIQRMADATPELAARFGVEHRPGVMLTEFIPNSRLDAMLEPGTIIIKALDFPVTSIEQLLTILSSTNLRRGAPIAVVHPDGSIDGVVLYLAP
jgi:serine protease Do